MKPKIRGVLFALAMVAVALAVAIQSETSTANSAATARPSPANQAQQHIKLAILTTATLNGQADQPRFVPASATAAQLKHWTGNITVKKGQTVTLTIVNHDDGAGPLEPNLTELDNVQGGSESVDGAAITSVPNSKVAHTFTVPTLRINAVIPAAPSGGTNTIVLTFKATQTGEFPWQCFDPCGTGPEAWSGAMDAPGWMNGTVTVVG